MEREVLKRRIHKKHRKQKVDACFQIFAGLKADEAPASAVRVRRRFGAFKGKEGDSSRLTRGFGGVGGGGTPHGDGNTRTTPQGTSGDCEGCGVGHCGGLPPFPPASRR